MAPRLSCAPLEFHRKHRSFASGDVQYSTGIANAQAWRTTVLSRRTNTPKYDAKAKVDAFDWPEIIRSLDADGTAVLPRLLEPGQCARLAAGYSNDDLYRSRIVMARHGFGRGEYKYYRYPLPELLQDLRQALYSRLAPIANRWHKEMGIGVRYPSVHADFIRRCHRAGQKRPTPLILQYFEGDYNCLHQDLYGAHVFPLQATILLSKPGTDFEGGEFVVTDAGAREKRADVVQLAQGDAVILAVNRRPVTGSRGPAKTAMRHGVSRVRRGLRHTVGIVFHDAR